MEYFRVDPSRIVEYKGDKVDKIKSVAHVPVPVGNNNVIVTGVAGKIIRVHGWTCQGVGAASADSHYAYKTGNTTVRTATKILNFKQIETMPLELAGYFETGIGDSLVMYVASGDINVTTFYTMYTPNA